MRVLIVDDHRLFGDVVRAALEAQGIEVMGPALTGEEGCELARTSRPDVALVDIGLPDRDGFEVGLSIRTSFPETRIVALTALTDDRFLNEASKVGFDGFVSKFTPMSAFVEAVKAAADGHRVFAYRGAPSPASSDESLLARQLTTREREVLGLLVDGLSGGAIAERLNISAHTVRTHVHSILTKLQVHTRLEAVTFAVRNQLVDDGKGRPGFPRSA